MYESHDKTFTNFWGIKYLLSILTLVANLPEPANKLWNLWTSRDTCHLFFVPMALFSSLSRRVLGTRSDVLWRKRISQSLTLGPPVFIYAVVMFLYSVWDCQWRLASQDLWNFFSDPMWYQFYFGLIVFFNRQIWHSLNFKLLPYVFESCHGCTESFILVVSLLNALMRDQNELTVSCLMVLHF